MRSLRRVIEGNFVFCQIGPKGVTNHGYLASHEQRGIESTRFRSNDYIGRIRCN